MGGFTTYTPTSSNTLVQGGDGGGQGMAIGGPDDLLKRLIDKRLRGALYPKAAPAFRGATSRVGTSSPAEHGMRGTLAKEQEAAAIAKARAISGTVPMKITQFASNANNAAMPDVNSYTGAQREAYLPGNAPMGPGGADTLLDQERALASSPQAMAKARALRDLAARNYGFE